ncbi:MAG: DUF2905 domain-containing protein [Armatimonadetes bacterium]|nr:DUF2905 domain-containing protein [Armatimonadota bacterium]
MGKFIVGAGALIVVLGLVVMALEAVTGGRPGALPGDVVIRRGNTTLYFPIATCIVVSLVLSALLYLLSGMRR